MRAAFCAADRSRGRRLGGGVPPRPADIPEPHPTIRVEGEHMEFRRVRLLRGPNMWANFPVLEAWVDLGPLKDSASTSIPGFNDRLMSWLPTMIEHQCSEGVRGGFFQRLREGTYPAHILEHVTL